MTTVTFFRDESGTLTGFQASGHAGYAKYGQDIVCAAISALTQATANGITEVAKAKAQIRSDEDSGFLELIVDKDNQPEEYKMSQVLLKSLELALTEIKKNRQYTGTIRINYRERR